MGSTIAEHPVAFVLFPGVASFDVAGPAQALAATGVGRYGVTLFSRCGGVVTSDCPGVSFDSVAATEKRDRIGTLFIPGGRDAPSATEDADLIGMVGRLAGRADRIACVCTGAFLAAEAGLLAGRRAATHWRYCDRFAQRYPRVEVDRNSIWVRDGHVWSSAGISAGVDLTLALIEQDHGSGLALEAARELVVFLKRPGGQSQFSTVLSGQIADADGPLGPLLAWIADNLGENLRGDRLAERAGMSLRTFARAFRARTGSTPARVIEALRVQAARAAIEAGDTALKTVARRYGFGDEQRMRRAFSRQLRATPTEFRERFGA